LAGEVAYGQSVNMLNTFSRQTIGLLCDRNAGHANVVAFETTGGGNLDATNCGWRKSWDMMVVGDFSEKGRQQGPLYDRSDGQAGVVAFDTKQAVSLDTRNSGWATRGN
jgi:hypothetical protein